MACRLQRDEMSQLLTWIGGRRKYSLLYKISRDGCNASTFHSKCDNKGPTVTVLYNTSDTIYGGFTSISWGDGGGYKEDPKAFLFQLKYNGTWGPKQYKIKPSKCGNAINCHSNNGPTFGAGHDIYTFSGSLSSSNNIFPLNGSCSLNNTYDMLGDDYSKFTNGNLQVKDLEVYQIDECDMNDPLEKPWRRSPEMTTQLMQDLKEEIEAYKPLKELKVLQAKILLIGQVGAGKSSYFNTVNSIFRGYVTSQACSGTAEHSLTTQYRMYQVRNGRSGLPLNFRLCDTRGLEEEQGIDSQEISYILDGNIPDKYVFNPSMSLSSDSSGFIKSPKLKDRIHCVAFVVDASTVDVISEKVLEKMRKLQIPMNQRVNNNYWTRVQSQCIRGETKIYVKPANIQTRGLPQVVLLTKIDKVCEPIQNDVSMTYFIPTIQDYVDKVALMIGLPRAHVIPVKNYESEMELDQNINILSLLSMQQILHFADDFMYNFLDEVDSEKMNTTD